MTTSQKNATNPESTKGTLEIPIQNSPPSTRTTIRDVLSSKEKKMFQTLAHESEFLWNAEAESLFYADALLCRKMGVAMACNDFAHNVCQKYLPALYFLCKFKSRHSKRNNNKKIMEIFGDLETRTLNDFLDRHIAIDKKVDNEDSPGEELDILYEETAHFMGMFFKKHFSGLRFCLCSFELPRNRY